MVTSTKKSRATENWISLPKEVQVKALKRVWAKQAGRIKRDHPNVASVGLGHKTVGGAIQPYMCLAFLVDWKSDTNVQLPTSIKTTVAYEGKRVHVAIPTDVEELRDSGPQDGYNAAGGVVTRSESFPGKVAGGAICCLVRLDRKPGLYLLSCHHVLTLAQHVGRCSAAPDATVFTPNGLRIGALLENFPLQPGSPSQVDAAIAEVDGTQSVTWNHSGVQPVAVNMGHREPPSDCTVYAPDGTLIPATYLKTFPGAAIKYPGCGEIHVDCYQFQARTKKGHSGSPIISNDGTLQAMHFWGNNGGTFSLAIPAGYMFAPGFFNNGDLVLA